MTTKYLNEICSLVEDGNVVIQIFLTDENCLYFVPNKFSQLLDSANSTPLNVLQGFNITQWLEKTAGTDKNLMLQSFVNYVQNANVMRVEFPQAIKYIKYAPYN